jgi:DnaJ-domain-containing protein 1
VLQGQFAGRRLEELNRDEVMALLRECRLRDSDSAMLIEAYLDRIAGEEWRSHSAGQGDSTGAKATPKTAMTTIEARAILGVGPNATADEIRATYHQLMKKLHPDHGGSTFLASQINAAKSALLGD